jgi:hypothetical protein
MGSTFGGSQGLGALATAVKVVSRPFLLSRGFVHSNRFSARDPVIFHMKALSSGLLNCLLPPWQERPETADRLRSGFQSVIDYVIAHQWGWQFGLLKRGKVMPSPQKL